MANARKYDQPTPDYFPGETDNATHKMRVDPNTFPKESDAANINERSQIWVEPDLDRMSQAEKNDVWARYSDGAPAAQLDHDAQSGVWSSYESDAPTNSMFDAQSAPRRKSNKGLLIGGAAAVLVIAGAMMAVTANDANRATEAPSATQQALNDYAANPGLGASGVGGVAPSGPSMSQPAADAAGTTGAGSAASPSASPVAANTAVPPAEIKPAATKPSAAKPVAAKPKTATVPATADDNLDAALPPTYWQGAPNPAAMPATGAGAAGLAPTPSEALPPQQPASTEMSAPPAAPADTATPPTTPPAAATTPGALNLTPTNPSAPATGSLEPAPVPGTAQFDAAPPVSGADGVPSSEPLPQ